MSLAERLGYKTLNELYATMGNNEIMEWAAYDKTRDQDWVQLINKENSLELQKQNSAEEEAAAIKLMFQGLTKNGADK